MKHWFITGISRGLGLALARAALDRGDRVAGTVRTQPDNTLPKSDRLYVILADLAHPEAPQEAIYAAIAALGHLDIVVNNAGYGLLGALETASDEEIEQLFTVNVYAPFRAIRAVLPHMRARHAGRIINITSIAGRAPTGGSALYAASKHALEGLSAGLALETEPMGIHVTSVAPGAFRTDFLSDHSIRHSTLAPDDYVDGVGKALERFTASHGTQRGDPARAATALLALADSENPPRQLLLGRDALERMSVQMTRSHSEMVDWQDITTSTDFPETPDA